MQRQCCKRNKVHVSMCLHSNRSQKNIEMWLEKQLFTQLGLACTFFILIIS